MVFNSKESHLKCLLRAGIDIYSAEEPDNVIRIKNKHYFSLLSITENPSIIRDVIIRSIKELNRVEDTNLIPLNIIRCFNRTFLIKRTYCKKNKVGDFDEEDLELSKLGYYPLINPPPVKKMKLSNSIEIKLEKALHTNTDLKKRLKRRKCQSAIHKRWRDIISDLRGELNYVKEQYEILHKKLMTEKSKDSRHIHTINLMNGNHYTNDAITAIGKLNGIHLQWINLFYSYVVCSHFVLLTTLIKSSGKLNFLGLVLFIIGVAFSQFLKVNPYTNYGLSIVCSFFIPQYAFKYVIDNIHIATIYDTPIHYVSSGGYTLPILLMAFFMFLHMNFIIYLSFYLDIVVPIDASPKKHPLFIFGYNPDKNVTVNKTNTNEEISNDGKYFEPSKNDGIVGIEAINVIKEFHGEKAVNNVSFKAYENEVTALLGHNGAGKSTLFGCLTGFITPTSGKITTKGDKKCGYTPQWDPLFQLLTVREHLEFYGKLKNNSVDDAEITRIIEEIGLVGKDDVRGKDLSGGMKRKLSVGMALIGGSEIILLDEPTAGMDPMARKVVIDIINGLKSGRTILITTHYMDEAELLSDRIIIMCKGEMVCNGSSDFLKRKLETGYILSTVFNVSERNDTDYNALSENVFNLIKKHCDSAKIDGPIGRQFTILLSHDNQKNFVPMFEELESKKDEMKIDSFGIAAHGLEQVFIKITDSADAEGGETAKKLTSNYLEISSSQDRSWIKQIYALLIRKLHYEKRNISHIIIPVISMLLFLFLLIYPMVQKSNVRDGSIETVINVGLMNSPKMIIGLLNSHTNIDIEPGNKYPNFPPRSHSGLLRSASFRMGEFIENELKRYPQVIVKEFDSVNAVLDSMRDYPPLGFIIKENDKGLISIYVRDIYESGTFDARNVISNAILKSYGDKGAINTNFVVSEDITVNNPSMLIKILFPLFLPLMFMMSIYLCNKEKKLLTNHLYRLTGISEFTYWLPLYIIDLLYGLLLGLIMLTTAVLIISKYEESDYAKYAFGMILPVSVVLLTRLYIFGRYIKNPTTGLTAFIFMETIMTCIFYMLLLTIVLLTKQTDAFSGLFYIIPLFFPLLPYYDMPLFVLLSNDIGHRYTIFVVLLHVYAVIYLVIFSIESFVSKINWKKDQNQSLDLASLHPDVVKEIEKTDSCNTSDYTVVSRRLSKKFKKFVAVECLSLSIPSKECFGLLGANGAGKSTSFNMLTGTLKPTSGTAFVDGFDVMRQPRFGFCPQVDAVLDELTVLENLNLFARLSGRRDMDNSVDILLDLLKLKHRVDNLVKNCSGGEKRRLSIGVAILTNSQVIMLDEPTAGIDPRTRRHVWDLLMGMRSAGTSIILSSHSMEECETLCTRIGFLGRGKMKGIGTSQHLKSVFGNSYTLKLTIGIQPSEVFDKINLETQNLMGCEATKSHSGSTMLVFSIPKNNNKSWSSLYKQVAEYVSQNQVISEFMLVETSLEEAFISTAVN